DAQARPVVEPVQLRPPRAAAAPHADGVAAPRCRPCRIPGRQARKATPATFNHRPACDGRVKVSLVIPTLNEEAGIGPTLDAVERAAFASRGWELEVVVVDGASKDRTRDIAAEK